jgi:hypothetical protein
MTEAMSSSVARILRRMPVKTDTVALDGDYAGWSATVRINPPLWILEEFGTGDVSKIKTALAGLVSAWNFVDEEGEPLAVGPEGIAMCPIDLLRALADAFQSAVTRAADVPKA